MFIKTLVQMLFERPRIIDRLKDFLEKREPLIPREKFLGKQLFGESMFAAVIPPEIKMRQEDVVKVIATTDYARKWAEKMVGIPYRPGEPIPADLIERTKYIIAAKFLGWPEEVGIRAYEEVMKGITPPSPRPRRRSE
jgi:hypothetical protein